MVLRHPVGKLPLWTLLHYDVIISDQKRLKLYPYKIQLVQALTPGDYEQGEQFAWTLLTNIEQNHAFLYSIFLIDEATFHVSGDLINLGLEIEEE